MKNKNYSKEELKTIKDMIKSGYTNKEIAEKLGRPKTGVSIIAYRMFGGNPSYMKRISKHKHLREKVLTYFKDHTAEETAKKFKLTMSEFKSCMTAAYRNPLMASVRKDKRRRDAWSSEELKYLLRASGVISRDEINLHLKRGKSSTVIKEKLQDLGVSSKNINGITLSQYRAIWNEDPEYYIKTTAGAPSGFYKDSFFKLVPWAYINELLEKGVITHTETFTKYVETMSMFQKWIHGNDYWKSLLSVEKGMKSK